MAGVGPHHSSDVVIATPLPVQYLYQAEQYNLNRVKQQHKPCLVREDYTQSISLLLYPEPLMGWDVVIATPFPVQYQTEQCKT